MFLPACVHNYSRGLRGLKHTKTERGILAYMGTQKKFKNKTTMVEM